MWVGKFLESSRVWVFDRLWKVRGYVGVESSRKVRGKFVESSKEWAWKVRGKFEGVGVERSWKIGGCGREKVHSRYAGGRGCAKLMERLRRGTVMCLETSRVWLESAWVTVCGSVSWALTWVETLSQLEKVRRDAVGRNSTVPRGWRGLLGCRDRWSWWASSKLASRPEGTTR
jgi:hypothetical protein